MKEEVASGRELVDEIHATEDLLRGLARVEGHSYHESASEGQFFLLSQADRARILGVLEMCKGMGYGSVSEYSEDEGHQPTLDDLLDRILNLEEEDDQPIRPEEYGLTESNEISDGFREWKKELSWSLFSHVRFPRHNPPQDLAERLSRLFGPPETLEMWDGYLQVLESRYASLESHEETKPPVKRRKVAQESPSRSQEEKHLLCQGLLDWIVSIPYDYEFPPDFDVLRGLTASEYGLIPTDKGSWKHQLLWSLLEDGRFTNYHGSFLTPLFGSVSPADVGPYDQGSEESSSCLTGTWLITVKSYKKQLERTGRSIPERPEWMRRVTESISEVKDPIRKARLRDLINYVRTIYSVYSRIKKTDFREDFDVLRGQRDTLYYGLPVDALRGVKTTSKYFLYQVLLNSCPELSEAKPVFYSGLLNCTVKALTDFKNNHADVLEALLPRLEPHERDPEEVFQEPIDENSIDLKEIFITAGEALSLDCFKEGYIGDISGQNLCVTYSAVTLSHCFSKLKDQLVRSPFALVGSKAIGHNRYEGRFLVSDHPGGADVQLKRAMDFLVHGMGFTLSEFYSQVFGSWIKRRRKRKNKEETELLSKPNEELTQELSSLSEDFAQRYETRTNQPITFKTFNEKQSYTISIVPEFPWHEVEYLSLVYGHSKDNLVIRNFLSQESADKFRNEDFIPSRGQRFSKYSFFNIFCKMILVSCNLDWKSPKCVELFSYIPDFISEFYDPYLELSTRIQFLKNALSTLVAQCPHCGKVIKSESTKRQRNRLTAHIRKCYLEVTACGCSGIKFKSYADKKRHIAFVHSGKKYVSCRECDYYTTSEHFMENHVNRNHGKPGESFICSICAGTFRSPYYLSLHMFQHEQHKCEFCGLEIMGRNNYKIHKRKVHAAGFKCQYCPKLLDSQWRLEKHVKISHKKCQYL